MCKIGRNREPKLLPAETFTLTVADPLGPNNTSTNSNSNKSNNRPNVYIYIYITRPLANGTKEFFYRL